MKNFYEIDSDDELSMTAEEAQILINQATSDMNGAYMNDKAPRSQHEVARALVDRLRLIAAGHQSSLKGYMSEFVEQKKADIAASYGIVNEDKSSASGQRHSDDVSNTYHDIGDGTKSVKSAFGFRIADGGGEG